MEWGVIYVVHMVIMSLNDIAVLVMVDDTFQQFVPLSDMISRLHRVEESSFTWTEKKWMMVMYYVNRFM